MPDYSYYAVDKNGAGMRGVMPAENEWRLEERLEEIGYWLVEAKEQNRQRRKLSLRVSRRELIEFFNGMAVLLDAGVTAVDALQAMVEETTNESLKMILEDIEINVQSGNSIHDSMSKYSKVFSEQVCNIIHAGEYSGNLAITFNDLSEHLEWVDQLMADVKQASIYPAMILLAVIGLVSLLLTFVIPKFVGIFESAGLELPAITRAVITLGDYWGVVVTSMIVSLIFIIIGSRYLSGVRKVLDKFKFSVPVFGPINRMLAMSRFVHNLALMVKAGVPILEALSLCRKLVASPIMEEVIRDTEVAVSDGNKMSEALRGHNIVSPLVLRMMVVGEETGNLYQALGHVSERYNIEIPRRIKRAFGIMEPVIILVLVAVVGPDGRCRILAYVWTYVRYWIENIVAMHTSGNSNCVNDHCMREHGFTLMELIGVMAVVSIMAAVLAPSAFKLIDAAIGDAESSNVKNLIVELENSILSTKRIPRQNINDWVSAISAYSSLPSNKIEFNRRGFRRRIYVDPRFFTTSDAVFPGYTQTTGLTQNPNSPRIMLVSDLTRNAPNPPTSSAAFSAIWNQTGGATVVEGDKVKIQRLHLASAFHRVLLVNSNTQQAAYRIESGTLSSMPAAVGIVDGSATRYILRNSNLQLYASPYPSGGLLTLAIINSDFSYRYETDGSNWYWVRL